MPLQADYNQFVYTIIQMVANASRKTVTLTSGMVEDRLYTIPVVPLGSVIDDVFPVGLVCIWYVVCATVDVTVSLSVASPVFSDVVFFVTVDVTVPLSVATPVFSDVLSCVTTDVTVPLSVATPVSSDVVSCVTVDVTVSLSVATSVISDTIPCVADDVTVLLSVDELAVPFPLSVKCKINTTDGKNANQISPTEDRNGSLKSNSYIQVPELRDKAG